MRLIAQRQYEECGDEYLQQEDNCPLEVTVHSTGCFIVYHPGEDTQRIIEEGRVEVTNDGLRIWGRDEFFFVSIGQIAAGQLFSEY